MSRRHPHPNKNNSQSKRESKDVSLEDQSSFNTKTIKRADEPELRLPAYDPSKFWKIDWKALPVDFAFILFGIILSRGYFSNYFFTEISPTKLLALYLFVVIAVSWYMGFILGRYTIYYNETLNKMARWILGIAGITLLGYLMAIIITMVDDRNQVVDKSAEHFGMFATFMLVIGPLFGIGGYMTAQRAIKFEATGILEKEDDGEMMYVGLICMLVSVAFLVYVSQLNFVQQSSASFIWFIFIFIGAALAGVVAFLIMKAIKWFLVLIGLYYRLAFIFETAFPFVIISALIFWNEMQRHYLSGLSPTTFLGVLFFTGILPFRMMLVFNPPLRAINLLIGIASFAFYIWSVS